MHRPKISYFQNFAPFITIKSSFKLQQSGFLSEASLQLLMLICINFLLIFLVQNQSFFFSPFLFLRSQILILRMGRIVISSLHTISLINKCHLLHFISAQFCSHLSRHALVEFSINFATELPNLTLKMLTKFLLFFET